MTDFPACHGGRRDEIVYAAILCGTAPLLPVEKEMAGHRFIFCDGTHAASTFVETVNSYEER